MTVYKIQYEDIDYDCWGRTESHGWKDHGSNLYACEELAYEALKLIPHHLYSNFRIKEVEVIDYEKNKIV